MTCLIAAIVVRCGVPAAVSAELDGETRERALLLASVREIAAPGVPGPLVVYGADAFPVVAGRAGRELAAAVVAAGRIERGRVVAFGHTGYSDVDVVKVADTGALLARSVSWAAGRIDDASAGGRAAAGGERAAGNAKRVLVVSESWRQTVEGLRSSHGLNADVRLFERGALTEELSRADVLCVSQGDLARLDIREIVKFARGGGGLVVCGLGWGWLQLNPGREISQHPCNQLLRHAGILYADGTLDRTGKLGFATEYAGDITLLHAARALDFITANSSGTRAAKAPERAQAAWTATAAVRTLPSDDEQFRPRLRGLLAAHEGALAPTAQQPFRATDALPRLLLTLQLEELRDAPPERVRAHPAAAEFPGAVPDDAPRVTREVVIDPCVGGWHSTGLYAAAGEIVRVHARGASPGEWRLRIGAHTDRLWDKDAWKRAPEVASAFPLDSDGAKPLECASAFGGLIYVDVGAPSVASERGAARPADAVTVTVRIEHAIEAPYFVRGETSIDEWRSAIRRRPAPWAELATAKIILTVPARVVREIDDPEPLLRFWDEVLDAHATLAAQPLHRPRPERIVTDVQISAGYMHAGYPIMTHLDVEQHIVDVERLRRGDAWGFFHELGHNFQHGDWTFDGTGEVTCNLFTLHALETVCALPAGTRGHAAVDKPPSVAAHLNAGAPFGKWKSDPFLALQFYIQLRDAFGWDVFRRVFAEYRELPATERPRGDDAKRDQWLVRFSRAVGRNLGPFFQAWGVPTSDAARASIADLPEWMPDGFPPTP
ncbi:MAG: M60 family metallopeptidase [Phycisphaerae bacterium]